MPWQPGTPRPALARARAELLADPGRSDMAIAALARCTAPTVARARRSLQESGLIEAVPASARTRRPCLQQPSRTRDPASLTRDECLLLTLGEVRTEVNSGGFDFYLRYRYRKNASTASEAAHLAGCPARAALIEEAIALVGPDLLHHDDEDALYDRLEQVEDDLRDFDRRFIDLEKTADLDAALSRLVARFP